MEVADADAQFLPHGGKFTLGFVKAPQTGHNAAVFIAVAIAHHNHLHLLGSIRTGLERFQRNRTFAQPGLIFPECRLKPQTAPGYRVRKEVTQNLRTFFPGRRWFQAGERLAGWRPVLHRWFPEARLHDPECTQPANRSGCGSY